MKSKLLRTSNRCSVAMRIVLGLAVAGDLLHFRLAGAAGVARGQEFEVDGHMDYLVYLGMPTPQAPLQQFPFKVSVSGANWLIRTVTMIPPGEPYFEVGFDGRYVYSFFFLTAAPGGARFNFNGSGSIEDNDTPPDGLAPILWTGGV